MILMLKNDVHIEVSTHNNANAKTDSTMCMCTILLEQYLETTRSIQFPINGLIINSAIMYDLDGCMPYTESSFVGCVNSTVA